jgi:hypothetical protein
VGVDDSDDVPQGLAERQGASVHERLQETTGTRKSGAGASRDRQVARCWR